MCPAACNVRPRARLHLHRGARGRVGRTRAGRGRRQLRAAGIHDRRLAGCERPRKPRSRPQRDPQRGPGISSSSNHREPGAGRPAQGRQQLRPADRARRPGRRWPVAAGAACARRRPRRTRPRWACTPLPRRAARSARVASGGDGDDRGSAWQRPGGASGARCRRARSDITRRRPTRPPGRRDPGSCSSQPEHGDAGQRSRPGRCARTGAGAARPRDCRRGTSQSAVLRATGRWQVDAGAEVAGPAAAVGVRAGARGDGRAFGGGPRAPRAACSPSGRSARRITPCRRPH